jgi:myo-inositol 2-dehydrogenase/D-chiro-inositol 1-dehydrogenase
LDLKRLKIGFAGAGYICGVHKNNLVLDNRVEIASTFDPDPARGDAAGFDETLEKSDAVYITAPNTKHVELALRAIAAGKHVFCEKPMAANMEDAQRVLEAAQASKRVFQVGHNRRFAKVYKRVKSLLAASPPHTAHIKMNRGELLKPVWTADETVTGGFLFETPIHMFDMMRFQFGEVASLDARLSGKDDFSMLVEFTSGMHATFVTSADASWFFPYERMEIFGAYSTIETAEMESLSYRIGLEAETRTEDFREVAFEEKLGFREEDRLFVDAILTGGAPPVTAHDGYRSVELACACYRSVAERRRISLSRITGGSTEYSQSGRTA